ncbi:MAG: hypothetical protein K1X92_00305 [Bacteroidia bacterium]|nr:hypothetical protein [Bacteroidia bacterium]
MKKIFSVSGLLFLSQLLWAQSFDLGNQWYKNLINNNPNRLFVKMEVGSDGIYQVSKTDLLNAGHDLSTADARTLKIYYRGVEIPIYVSPANSATFDFFEFIGKQNDGRVDSLMYRDPATGVVIPGQDLQPIKQMSIFSDTSAYFLTWEPSVSGGIVGKRFTPVFSNNYTTPSATFLFDAAYIPTKTTGTGYPQRRNSNGGSGSNSQYSDNHILNSDYTTGEGWIGPDFSSSSYYTLNLKVPYANTNPSVSPRLSVRVFGKSDTQHGLRVFANNTAVINKDTVGVYCQTYHATLNQTLPATTPIRFEGAFPIDNNSLCWINLRYERLASSGMDTIPYFELPEIPLSASNQYYAFPKVKGNTKGYAFDVLNQVRVEGDITGTGVNNKTLNLIFPASSFNRDVIVVTDLGYKKPVINPTHNLNQLYSQTGAPFLIITHRDYTQAATAYKTYRDTNTVNNIPAKIVYVEDMYDEYGYGSVTPWAIKRFCKEALDSWTVKPEYILLLGKAIDFDASNNSTVFNLGTVPSIGNPVSDFEFVSHYNPNSHLEIVPRVPIGRIVIENNQQGLDYLNKVIDHEHQAWDSWKKEGVFLGGGNSNAEVSIIQQTLQYGKSIFEGDPFGGHGTIYQKYSNSTTDPNADYDYVINKGTAWIHFFGHSGSNIVDVDLKEPYEYTNFHKYPFVFAMGCYGGKFDEKNTFGSRWVIQPERGAIGYLANTGPGYAYELSRYSNLMYNWAWKYEIGERMGDIMKEVFEKYLDTFGTSIRLRNHIRQLDLQGDPAVRMNVPGGYDLELTNSGIFFTPDNFSAMEDSFKINVIVKNLGLVSNDSFYVSFRQQLPSGEWYNHPNKKMAVFKFSDTLSVYLKNPVGAAMAGYNTFEIFADSTNFISETNENNNIAIISKLIPGNIPACLFPFEFSVIDYNDPQLIASGFSMTRDSLVKYVFEIDTTYDFTSPLMRTSEVVTGKSMLAKWDIPYTLTDSMVYYWRVRLADITPLAWANSSFRYIQGKKGWAQARIPQFIKDAKTNVELELVQDKWVFTKKEKSYSYRVRSFGFFEVFINDAGYVGSSNFSSNLNGVAFMIIDKNDLTVKYTSQTFSNTVGYAAAPTALNTGGSLNTLITALQSANPGDYFFISSNRNPRVPFWQTYIFDYLESIGVSAGLRNLGDNEKFLIYGRIGNPSTVQSLLTPNIGGDYVVDVTLSVPYQNASAFSTIIGPSKGWTQLIWDWNTIDNQLQEFANVSVYGLKQDGSETFMFKTTSAGTYNLDTISHETYPFIQLKSEITDSIYSTAPQLEHWHILYNQAPDAVIDPFGDFYFKTDTLAEGADLKIRMGAVNPSKINMDSLLVSFRIETEDRDIIQLGQKKFAPLPKEGRIVIDFEVNTLNMGIEGSNKFIVELNPGYDQPEQYLFNNTYIHPFFVISDKENPLLHVTFDGKEIMDLDIISPTPKILIEAKDENQFLAMTDTSTFDVYWRNPQNGAQWERIRIDNSDPRIEWEPATLPLNKARLTFSPGAIQPLADSENDYYSLRVQGRDMRGNDAGKSNYEISFRVINAHTVTNVLNYPNPFSTSTRFAYILTGNELPEMFQIQIFTITGKLVKVIDLKALGDVHFGKNLTDFAWDGTDEYGDRLANGVYLYRVVTKMQTNTLKESAEDDKTDKMFKNGWGKMYIMR